MKTNNRTETTNRLTDLMNHRNALINALEQFADIEELTESKNKTIHELCETMAQISVYKTLLHLADSVTSFSTTEETESNGHRQTITTSGADYCDKLYRSFASDMHIYRTQDLTATYSDAMDLFTTAYMTIWAYLRTSAPLTLDDIVLTIPKKSGGEKNYTLFQTACKSIRESIHQWSKTDSFKKLHYIIGYTDEGEEVTSSKRPKDDLTDIDEETATAFYNRYGLTAQQREIVRLIADGESTATVSALLNLPLRTVQDNLAKAKAKFTTANAYAEYITAKNAEKIAKAKAEKHSIDRFYQGLHLKAQIRKIKAYEEYRKAFAKENHLEYVAK